MAMGRRAALLLASLTLAGAVAGCVPPAPLSVSGNLPSPSSTYALVGEDDLLPSARAALVEGLASNGLRYRPDRPDRLVALTFADRPRASGAVAGVLAPVASENSGWIDRPAREGLFTKGRREIRLTIRFLSSDGALREERVVTVGAKRTEPAADMQRLILAALRR